MNKNYRLVYDNGSVVILGEFDSHSATVTDKPCFETDVLSDMKAKISELGLELDPVQHADFM